MKLKLMLVVTAAIGIATTNGTAVTMILTPSKPKNCAALVMAETGNSDAWTLSTKTPVAIPAIGTPKKLPAHAVIMISKVVIALLTLAAGAMVEIGTFLS